MAGDPGLNAWYVNSLKAWKKELQKRHRSLMADYARKEKNGDPYKEPLGKLLQTNAWMIEIIDCKLMQAKA